MRAYIVYYYFSLFSPRSLLSPASRYLSGGRRGASLSFRFGPIYCDKRIRYRVSVPGASGTDDEVSGFRSLMGCFYRRRRRRSFSLFRGRGNDFFFLFISLLSECRRCAQTVFVRDAVHVRVPISEPETAVKNMQEYGTWKPSKKTFDAHATACARETNTQNLT